MTRINAYCGSFNTSRVLLSFGTRYRLASKMILASLLPASCPAFANMVRAKVLRSEQNVLVSSTIRRLLVAATGFQIHGRITCNFRAAMLNGFK